MTKTTHPDKHQCIGKLVGDWIVFKCLTCSFERHTNVVTSETKPVLNGSDPYTLHEGFYLSDDVAQAMYN
jgi:hypothetical protein